MADADADTNNTLKYCEVTELSVGTGNNAKKYTVIEDDIIVNENRFLDDGTISAIQTPYVALKIKSPKHAAAASLHLILKHVADMHTLILQILSEKYNIPYNDFIDVISEDERIQRFMIEPVVHSMNYFTQEDLDKTLDPVSTITESMAAAKIEEAKPEPKKLTRPKMKISFEDEQPTQPIVETPAPPKKKIIRKKKITE